MEFANKRESKAFCEELSSIVSKVFSVSFDSES